MGNGERIRYGYTKLNQLEWEGVYKSNSANISPGVLPVLTDSDLSSLTYYGYDLAGRRTSKHDLWFEDVGGIRRWPGESEWVSEYIDYNYPESEIVYTRADGETSIVNVDGLGRPEYVQLYDGGIIESIYGDNGKKIIQRIPASSENGIIERTIELTAIGQVKNIMSANGFEILSAI